MKGRVLLIWIGIAVPVLVAFGGSPGAGDAAHVFRDGIGARARGMGGAHVARGGDVTGLIWNPALLLQTPSLCLGGVHESRYGGLVSAEALIASVSQEVWGAGVLWYGSEIYSVYYLGSAFRFGAVDVGFGAKAYNIGAPPQRARGVGFDVGCRLRVDLEETVILVGFASRDLGWTKIVWQSVAGQAVDHAAWVTRIGGAVASRGVGYSLAICGDLEVALRRPPLSGSGDDEEYWRRALQLAAAVGGEFQAGWLTLRGGLSWNELSAENLAGAELSFGAGFDLKGIEVDVALVWGDPGPIYVFGAVFRFGFP